MKGTFVCNESIISSYSQVMDCLPLWLANHLLVRPRSELPSEDSLHVLWALLGADPFVLQEIKDLGFVYRNGSIQVAWDRESDDELAQRVTFTLLSLWRFRKHRESRWLYDVIIRSELETQ